MLKNLIWKPDRMLLGDLVFRLEQGKDDATWELGEECFIFYKGAWTVMQYEQFWASRQEFVTRNVFEFGIWDGGSTAFWFEWLQPRKLVAADLMDRGDSPYFQRYLKSRGLQDRIKTYWRTDQGDTARLLDLYRKEFDGPLDLVLDDASHCYRPTRATFETLFPLLRPGGLYIIEDWAWAHWPEYHTPDHPCTASDELNRLVLELVEAAGSTQVYFKAGAHDSLIESITVFPHFTAIERGKLPAEVVGKLNLDARICRRPASTKLPTAPPVNGAEPQSSPAEAVNLGGQVETLRHEVGAKNLEMVRKNEEIQSLRDKVYDLELKYTPLSSFTGILREMPRAAMRAIKRRMGR